MLATFAGGMVAFAVLYRPMFLPELYGTRLRYSGASVSYNLGGVMGGALAPVIAASLLAATGATSLSVSLYILGMAVLSFGCVFLLSETYLNDISGIRSEEGQPAKGTA